MCVLAGVSIYSECTEFRNTSGVKVQTLTFQKTLHYAPKYSKQRMMSSQNITLVVIFLRDRPKRKKPKVKPFMALWVNMSAALCLSTSDSTGI